MYKYLIICFSFYLPSFVHANNLQIGSVTESIVGANRFLNFTISWDNSWRVSSNPGNWDAVWIFVKRRDCAGLQWRHADLSDQEADHTAGSPLLVDAYSDKKGVMIYRSTVGSGNITSVSIQIKLDGPPSGNYEYKVFGIEMVYINQGAFYAGDAGTFGSLKTGSSGNPYHVTSEAGFQISPNGNDLWGGAGFNNGTSVPDSFPKGFNPFYCMKYEISQGQYADFLNAIAPDAVLNRYEASYANLNRYTISGTWPAFTAAAPDRACNWFGFKDLAAYLDWSALSPMTELEFEKAGRGGDANFPIIREFAWSGITATDADSIIAGTDGTPGEVVGNVIGIGSGLANFGNDTVLGPLRCGFAAKTSTNRFESGASFYGVMELSGNVFEMCYSLYNSVQARGANFTGTHGDGELSTTPLPGFANQNWPVEAGTSDANEYASIIPKGGAWLSPDPGYEMGISDRTYFVFSILTPLDPNTGRNNALGGRGVSRRQ